jgi:hypothetical protein
MCSDRIEAIRNDAAECILVWANQIEQGQARRRVNFDTGPLGIP